MNKNDIQIQAGLDVKKSRKTIEVELHTIQQKIKPLEVKLKLSNTSKLKRKIQDYGDDFQQELTSSLERVQSKLLSDSSKLTISPKIQEQGRSNSPGDFVGIENVIMNTAQTFSSMSSHLLRLNNQLLELTKVSGLTADGLKEITTQAFEFGTAVENINSQAISTFINSPKNNSAPSRSTTLFDNALKISNLSSGFINSRNTFLENLDWPKSWLPLYNFK